MSDLFQKPFPGVKLGSPRTITVTILSNDNAFGIISFNMVWFLFSIPLFFEIESQGNISKIQFNSKWETEEL